ncbi:hypothetical protein BAMA_07920 [Bacillus manliponensis]|uniref:DUF5081 domain-containing protein n=1 Tax=Bacillus manliponensis TaxID=574376 RepID=A0A073K6V0_9BACI|nr:DUF5081 family protein [Bacillus manliponensis]KEK17953.1 hypothetical protein BAMA_07920 [Bacillus manliponensis]
MQEKQSIFTPAELYVLAGAADVTHLFGLSEREQILMGDPDCVQNATARLTEKSLITETGGLTEGAFQLIELLKAYQESKEYTRINNLLIGFLPKDEHRVAVLTEIKPNEEYTVDYIAKRDVYFTLLGRIPFLMREPRETEHTFLTKRMTMEELETCKEMDLSEKDVLAIETFVRPHPKSITGEGKWECILYFTEGEDFVQIDVGRNRYEWVSLYALNKRVFDGLKMKYKKPMDLTGLSLGGIH